MNDLRTLPPLPSKKVLCGIVAFFFLLTFLSYSASLRNGFALLDDGLLIYENNAVRELSPATLKAIFTSYDPELYVPLTIFSYQIEYLISGYHPFIYHLTNLLLHTFSSFLVSWIALMLTRRKFVALFVGMLFAVHPLHVETVAWAAARKDVLSAFFFLASFASYLLVRMRAERKTRNGQIHGTSPIRHGQGIYILSLILFLLGLLAKVTIFTLPIILLLTEWFMSSKEENQGLDVSFSRTRLPPKGAPSGPRDLSLDLSTVALAKVEAQRAKWEAPHSGAKWGIRILLRTLPFFALSIFFGLIALGGKGDILGAVRPLQKLLLAGKSTLFVLGKILLPIRLSPFYPELHPINLSPAFLLSTLVIACCFLLALFILFISRSTVYSPFFPASSQGSSYWYTSIPIRLLPFLEKHKGIVNLMAFGWLFFFVTLAPTFMTPSKGGGNIYITSDRYAYLPSIGILLMVTMLLATFLENAGDARIQRQRTKGVFLGAGILLCAFAFLTVQQSLLWGNNAALFAHAAEIAPDFYFAHINHGAALRLERQHEKAADAFQRALALRPLGNTHGLLAQVLAEQNKLEEAITEFQKGIALNPEDYELHHGLGQIYALQGRFEDALAEYERALSLMPEAKNAYEKLSRRIGARRDVVFERIGILYGMRGDHARAIEYYQRALEENPDFADAHFNLAVGLGNLGKEEEALTHYEEAVRMEPLHIRARVNLAILYAQRGREAEARRLLEEVLEDDPRNAVAKNALEQLRR